MSLEHFNTLTLYMSCNNLFMSVFCSRAITLIIHIRHASLHYLFICVPCTHMLLYVRICTLLLVNTFYLPCTGEAPNLVVTCYKDNKGDSDSDSDSDDSNFFALCEFASLLVTAELEGRGAPCLELNIISTSQHSPVQMLAA